MKRRIAALLAAATLSMLIAVPASAAAPADGTCVSKGVTLLGGPTIAKAANGTLAGARGPGGNLVDFVILDHVFNGAEGTEAFLGLPKGTICG